MFMNRLNRTKQAQVIAALVEGSSINATVRMPGVAKHTILRLLADLGLACADYQDRTFRNLTCKRIQCDEIWQFCYAKSKNVPAEKQGKFGYGDIWTWVAMDADTKLVPSFMVGNRDTKSATMFIDDLAGRLANRVQLTTDGLKAYLEAVEGAFGCEVDYAMRLRFTVEVKRKRATLRRNASDAKLSVSAGIPTQSTFRRATSSARI